MFCIILQENNFLVLFSWILDGLDSYKTLDSPTPGLGFRVSGFSFRV